MNLSLGEGRPERLTGAVVSGEYFDVLRTRAWRGRLIARDDDRVTGGHPVAVISYGLWRRLFGASDQVIGQKIHINSYPFTVIGVAPPGFVGVSLDNLPEVWVPMTMTNQALPGLPPDFSPLTSRHFFWLNIVGRLKPGTTIAQAQGQLDVIARRRAAAESKERPRAVREGRLRREPRDRDAVVGAVSPHVVGPAGCRRARDAHRVRRRGGPAAGARRAATEEIAVRLAIGATRGRIIRQLLVESLLLAAIASVAGLLLASWSGAGLLTLLPADFPLAPTVAGPTSEPRVLLFTVLVTACRGLAFGLAPAWRASRPALVPALKQEATSAAGRRVGLRHVFVVAELALSVLLLVGAGLLVRTVLAFTHISPGFNTTNVLVASTDVALQGYSEERGRAFFDAVRARVAVLPGVKSVALGRMVPVESSGMRVTFTLPGHKAGGPDSPVADYNPVSPEFFRTLGIPLLYGRDFSPSDTASSPQALIVNRALVRKYFGGRNPVGVRLSDFGPPGNTPEIVGVVDDARYRTLRDEAQPMIYVALAQAFMPRMSLVVRTDVPPDAIESCRSRGSGVTRRRAAAVRRADHARADACVAGGRAPAGVAAGGLRRPCGLPRDRGALRRDVVRHDAPHEGVRHPPGARRHVVAGLPSGAAPEPDARRRRPRAGSGDGGAASRLLTSLLFDVSPSDVDDLRRRWWRSVAGGAGSRHVAGPPGCDVSAATALRYE